MKGTRSVAATKSLNHASAVDVRLQSVASITLARIAVRSRATLSAACADGPPSRHWSGAALPSGPARPSPAAAIATVAADRCRHRPSAAASWAGCWTRARQPSISASAAVAARACLRSPPSGAACARAGPPGRVSASARAVVCANVAASAASSAAR
eukprot:6212530-Pleurochrysis_carterae.AAC.1